MIWYAVMIETRESTTAELEYHGPWRNREKAEYFADSFNAAIEKFWVEPEPDGADVPGDFTPHASVVCIDKPRQRDTINAWLESGQA